MTKQPLLSKHIKAEAKRLGFSACGMAKAEPVDQQTIQNYQQWILQAHHADMTYLKNYPNLRFDPTQLMPGCKTIISLSLNYFPAQTLPTNVPQVAYYAYGKDYHDIMRNKIKMLSQFLSVDHPQSTFRICVDTAPMLERYWAVKAGLGWIGKHHNLIIPNQGSYHFLGELLVDIEADTYDTPLNSHCGSCHHCIDACPNHALTTEGLDSHRCLSYLTIEHRGNFSPNMAAVIRQQPSPYYIYGCDRCQIACPHNRFAQPHHTDELFPSSQFLHMQASDWQQLSRDTYQQLFKGSAVKRAKYEGLMRNIQLLTSKKD